MVWERVYWEGGLIYLEGIKNVVYKLIYESSYNLNCGKWCEDMIDHCSYTHNLSSCEKIEAQIFQALISQLLKLFV